MSNMHNSWLKTISGGSVLAENYVNENAWLHCDDPSILVVYADKIYYHLYRSDMKIKKVVSYPYESREIIESPRCEICKNSLYLYCEMVICNFCNKIYDIVEEKIL